MTTSNLSPLSMRFWICGVVLNVIRTAWPVCFSKAATADSRPGSMAPPLRTVISAADAAPEMATTAVTFASLYKWCDM